MARTQPPVGPISVVPALIVGISIVLGAWTVKGSLDRAADSLGGIRAGLTEASQGLQALAKAQGQARAAAPAPARRGPDPNKRYTIATNNSPKKGPDGAKVTLVEFSDFQ